MNSAIILHTLLRLARPTTLMMLVVFVLVYPTIVVMFMIRSSNISFDFERLLSLFAGPMMTSLIAFAFVSTSIGNTKSLDDGEYLALLFSRPLFRWMYVTSKWLAGSAVIISVAGLQTLVFITLLYLTGRNDQISFGFIEIGNMVLNSLQAAALVIMIFSFPARVGVMCFVGLLYFAYGVPLMCSAIPNTSLWLDGNFRSIVHAGSDFLAEIIYSPIDLEPYFNSVQVLWLPAVTYVSNILLYLWVAIVVMNNREFFYSN